MSRLLFAVLIVAGTGSAAVAHADRAIPAPDIFHASYIEFGDGGAGAEAGAVADRQAPEGGRASFDSAAPPWACFLSYPISSRQQVDCSAVLVSDRHLLTAAHCFSHGRPWNGGAISVGCGLVAEGSRGGFSFVENFQAVRVTFDGDWEARAGRDFAILQLDHAAGLPHIQLPESMTRFQDEFLVPSPLTYGQCELKSTIECRFSGYGEDPDLKRPHFRSMDQSPRNGLRGYLDRGALVLNGYGENIGHFYEGDSGGPFYCRTGPAAPWKLVAIASRGGLDRDVKISEWSVVASENFLNAWNAFLEKNSD